MVFIQNIFVGRKAMELKIGKAMYKILTEMIDALSDDITCVIAKDNVITHKLNGRGVSPIRLTYLSTPEVLKNSIIADKIIGKAASVLAVLAGVDYVYGTTMSESAIDYLTRHNIGFSYAHKVDIIINRTNDGMCPLESSVLNIDDPTQAFAAMNMTIAELMKNR
jgi:hypothetical protein